MTPLARAEDGAANKKVGGESVPPNRKLSATNPPAKCHQPARQVPPTRPLSATNPPVKLRASKYDSKYESDREQANMRATESKQILEQF